ncbi:hypothetical protein [Ferrovibrio sp.]|uniref:hypothetical protein n=1 Tax=Ferrovibrio sp. TaxID=1917215 RepID=UPI0025C436AC|nr:hypothetical protein [Ferrovibrio sp.]MBX3456033.1 hypothetical protein [Ferrovibrio sp.]
MSMHPAPTKIAWPLLILLLAGASIAYTWPMAPTPAAILNPAPVADASAMAALPPLADLRTTLQRPLFEPGRRMPATAAQPAQPAGPVVLGKYRLLGIVSAGGKRSAVLAPLEGGAARLQAAGSLLDDWTLAEVSESGLLLRRGAASESVRLRPNPPVAPQAPAK